MLPAGEHFGEFHGEDRYTTKESERPAAPAAVLQPVARQSAYGNCDFVELLFLICRWQKRPCGRRTSTLVKIGAGLLVGKLLAVSFGPAGLGLAANFRQLITVLGVLAGAGIFNGVTKYVAQYHDNPQQLRRVVGTSSAMVLGFSTLMALVFVLAAAPISQWDCLVIPTIRGWCV